MGWTVRGSNPSSGKRFSPPKRPDRLWGPPSLLLKGYWGSFPEVTWSVREVNHSPPSSAEVKNEWRYTSAPPYILSWRGTQLPCHLRGKGWINTSPAILNTSCRPTQNYVTALTARRLRVCGPKCLTEGIESVPSASAISFRMFPLIVSPNKQEWAMCVWWEIMTEMDSPIITVTGDRTVCQASRKADGCVMEHTQRVAARKSNLAMNQRARHAA
jgi:hypothetical protein